MSRQLMELTDHGRTEWCVCEGSCWSAYDGQGDGHVLAESGNQLVAKSPLRLKPRVLVNQAHRFQRHLKQDIGELVSISSKFSKSPWQIWGESSNSRHWNLPDDRCAPTRASRATENWLTDILFHVMILAKITLCAGISAPNISVRYFLRVEWIERMGLIWQTGRWAAVFSETSTCIRLFDFFRIRITAL